MSAKDFIEQAFTRAEKTAFPHIFTESEDLKAIYGQFLNEYKKFRKEMLSPTQIKLIEPFRAIEPIIEDGNDSTPGEPDFIYNLTPYDNSTQRSKKKFEDFIFELNDMNHLNSQDYETVAILSSKAVDFYHTLLENIESTNSYTDIMEDEKLILNEPNEYEKVSLPIQMLGEDFNQFQEITKQDSLIVAGCPTISYIQKWISKFNENSKIAMESIGYTENEITLNNHNAFFVNNALRFGATNAHIAYSNGDKKDKYEISFVVNDKVNIASSLLHEWFHALDLEVGYKVHKKNQTYASWDFILGNSDPKIKDIEAFKKGKDLATAIYAGISHEQYSKELNSKIIDFNNEIPEIIGKYLSPDINNGWNNLSFAQKQEIIETKPFKEVIPLTLSYQTSSEDDFVKSVGKLLKKITKEPKFIEAFPSYKSDKLTSRIKAIKEAVRLYSLERNLAWSHKSKDSKNHKQDGYTLIKSDFAVFSHFKSQYKAVDYLFLPHEMFARKVQSICQNQVLYKINQAPTNNDPATKTHFLKLERLVMEKSIYRPETPFHQRVQIIETIHAMGKFIDLKPSVKATEVKGLFFGTDTDNAKLIEAKIIDRKPLSKNNHFISQYKSTAFKNLKNESIEIVSSFENKKEANKMKKRAPSA